MNCVYCDGHGEVVCICLHAGQMERENFGQDCAKCHNHGYMVCHTCNGSGYLETGE
ncbi:hypothetical protein J9317_03490 [Metabacillus sp. KIGAM252]|uniref:Uncharacterized protein n=1 Tax=Metabacillus flavus TaxID=2823519 RepID=A0ABS5LAT9_9BACI|nr:hypothetical protein [Metabacillus flavus]MBS2967837.1 hypothetical protein [Metabacillus flavus]